MNRNLLLKEGNEFNYINNLIGFIFRTISERFRIKENFYKNQINEFYDLIAESIKDCSEMTLEKNYASFVIEYCRFFAQGNKNLVKKFLEGLNKNSFIHVFDKILIDNKDNFYLNTEKYNNELKSMKSNKKKDKSKAKETKDKNINVENLCINKIENEIVINDIESKELNNKNIKEEGENKDKSIEKELVKIILIK